MMTLTTGIFSLLYNCMQWIVDVFSLVYGKKVCIVISTLGLIEQLN